MKKLIGTSWVGVAALLVGLAGVVGTGCTTLSAKNAPLVIGVTPDYPPLAMMRGDKLAGLEVELGTLLADKLDRPARFIPLKWRQQTDALLDGRTDIIMSGLSMTRERELRVQFIEPFMKNSVMGMVRREDAGRFTRMEDILSFGGKIGVQQGSTADVFMQANCPQARRITVSDTANAFYELKRKRIDLFLNDGHAIAWGISEKEGDVSGVWIPLTEEYLAWAVRRNDTGLAADVNAVLQGWKRDGTLKAMLERWLPYAEKVEVPVGTRPELQKLAE